MTIGIQNRILGIAVASLLVTVWGCTSPSKPETQANKKNGAPASTKPSPLPVTHLADHATKAVNEEWVQQIPLNDLNSQIADLNDQIAQYDSLISTATARLNTSQSNIANNDSQAASARAEIRQYEAQRFGLVRQRSALQAQLGAQPPAVE